MPPVFTRRPAPPPTGGRAERTDGVLAVTGERKGGARLPIECMYSESRLDRRTVRLVLLRGKPAVLVGKEAS